MAPKRKKGKKHKDVKEAAAAKSGGRALPSKENAMFKSVLKMYETKQYKKGLKTCDTILKRRPGHGETLSMKGLLLNCTPGRKAEAEDFVKRGLRCDITSHVCWHVYGLLHRSKGDYQQAIKCYLNALRHDVDNVQILRDLSLLQVQMRDLSGYQETRRRLLTLKPNNRNNWIGFSMAHHLSKNYDLAVKILESYAGTLEKKAKDTKATVVNAGEETAAKKQGESYATFEESEILLYKLTLLHDAGRHEEALFFMQKAEHENGACDSLALRQMCGTTQLQLGLFTEAFTRFKELVEYNPENYMFHGGLQAAFLGVSQSKLCGKSCFLPIHDVSMDEPRRAALASIYDGLNLVCPRARAVRRIALDFCGPHEKFRARADNFVRKELLRGTPASFGQLKALYVSARKERKAGLGAAAYSAQWRVGVLGELVSSYVSALKCFGRLPSTVSLKCPNSSAVTAPTILAWGLYFLAQHYDFVGKHAIALRTIDEAITHTPTALELYWCKSRILKHTGDLDGAANVMDTARRMDLADRYINTKAAKYHLRANRVDIALRTISLFVKHSAGFLDTDQETDEGVAVGSNSSGSALDERLRIATSEKLGEMQCSWFELEAGEASERTGVLGRAIKYFSGVVSHFKAYKDDQFDFHTYCLRKMTLRSYVALLGLEDRIYAHPCFHRAVSGLLRCYLVMYANRRVPPPRSLRGAFFHADTSPLSASRKKRAKQKARKEAAKLRKARGRSRRSGRASQESTRRLGGASVRASTDPYGNAMLRNVALAPLCMAKDIVPVFCHHGGKNVETYMLAFDVAFSRGKLLAAILSVKRAVRLLGKELPANVAYRIMILAHHIQHYERVATSRLDAIPSCGVSLEVASKEIDELVRGAVPEDYAKLYMGDMVTRGGRMKRLAVGAGILTTFRRAPKIQDAEIATHTKTLSSPGKVCGLKNCVGVNAVLASMFQSCSLAQAHEKAHSRIFLRAGSLFASAAQNASTCNFSLPPIH